MSVINYKLLNIMFDFLKKKNVKKAKEKRKKLIDYLITMEDIIYNERANYEGACNRIRLKDPDFFTSIDHDWDVFKQKRLDNIKNNCYRMSKKMDVVRLMKHMRECESYFYMFHINRYIKHILKNLQNETINSEDFEEYYDIICDIVVYCILDRPEVYRDVVFWKDKR